MDAISAKHADDVVVFECKNGPTHYTNGLLKMDAWVMAKSWAKAAITVYEIKTDRRDFVRDTKWPGYLHYCNLFYFAAPKGIIKPEELPADAGLMELVGKRLVIRKKAPHRQQEIDPDVFRYILMCRITVDRFERDPTDQRADRIATFKQMLADGKDIGWSVRGALHEKTLELERVQRTLQYAQSTIESQRRRIEELQKAGGDPQRDRAIAYSLERLVKDANRLLGLVEKGVDNTPASLVD